MLRPPARTSQLGSFAVDNRTPVVEDGGVRCGILRAWPEVLDELGVDADALFAEAGLSRAHFEDPENTITYSVGALLLQRSVDLTHTPHLGILISAPLTLSALGAMGFLMRASPTVAHALGLLAQHFAVHDRGGQVTVETTDAVSMLGYRVKTPSLPAVEQIHMIAAGAATAFVRELCGPQWRPLEVQLPFRRPATTEPFSRVLRAPLRFDADRMNVVFPTSDLARSVATADPVLYRMMAERIQAVLAMQHQDLPGRVRDLLKTQVFLPACNGEVVAGRLGMSLRTLKRRLQDSGTTLQSIRDEVLAEAATQLLRCTDKSATEIGLILGYADASAFTRAFQRWHGMAPGQWRSLAAAGNDAPTRAPTAARA